MFVISTSGHIDHGKSALVQALTGINPDRLPEEQERQMTIDLGFAHLRLSSGETVGIVDVPGHKDLMRNAIAGLWGVDAVLLIIAADDGWMPQTEEHLHILDLFHVKHGIVALTKVDLITQPGWLDMVEEDIRSRLKSTSLADAEIIRVSSKLGTNIPQLKTAIEQMVNKIAPKRDIAKPRLPVDRVFSIKGSGTVVTGTLIDGTLTAGQNIVIYPRRITARIRTIEAYGEKVEQVRPGTRTALNLVGLEKQDIGRGDIIFTDESQIVESAIIDVKIQLNTQASVTLKTGVDLEVFLGTKVAIGRTILLEKKTLTPGSAAFAQFRFQEPVATRIGDSFIIREPAPGRTIGGGTVLDPAAVKHKSRDAGVIPDLENRSGMGIESLILSEAARRRYILLDRLLIESLFSAQEVKEGVARLVKENKLVQSGNRVLQTAFTQVSTGNIAALVSEYIKANPLEKGIPQADIQTRLDLPPDVFEILIEFLLKERKIAREGNILTACGRKPEPTDKQSAIITAIMDKFEKGKTSPPTRKELETDIPGAAPVLRFLLAQKRLAELPEDILFETPAWEKIKADIIAYGKAHDNRINIQQVRELTGMSRKYTLPMLNKLDSMGITRRQGDERVLTGKV